MGVSAVVVTWNSADLLPACLNSLGREAGLELVVVDNASTDGTPELAARLWPGAKVIRNHSNRGFTRANNQGVRAAAGDRLLLINVDARLGPGALAAMSATLDAEPRTGVVGPRLTYGDGSFQRWTAGRFPGLVAALVYFLFLERLLPSRFSRFSLYLGRDVREPFVPDWVSSACMLVRRQAYEAVGGMDESVFVYMDDVDLCQRLRDAGWLTSYCPAAGVTHLMGQSSLDQPGSVSPQAVRSFNTYFGRRHGRASRLGLRLVEAAGFGLRCLVCAAGSLVPPGRPRLRRRAAAHWTRFKVVLQP